jgi:hypothetical protein
VARRNQLIRTLAGASGALLVLTAVSGCSDANDDTTPDKRDFPLSGRTLTVDSRNSDLVIRPADVDRVQVTRWFSGWSVLGSSPEAHWGMKDDKLTLRFSCGRALVQNCSARH